MAEESKESKPTKEQVVECLVRLGQALNAFAYPRSDLGLPGNLRPHEALRLKGEIAELEKVVETAACDSSQTNLRAVLDVRRDQIPDSMDIRVVAYVAWHSLTSDLIGISVGRVVNSAGLSSIEEMIKARHSIRQYIVKGDVLVFKDENELLPGEKLVRLLSGNNRLIVWSEATLKHEAEEGQRLKNANVLKRVSPPDEATKPAPINPPVPQVSLKACESPKAIFNALSRTVIGLEKSDTFRSFCVAMSLHLRSANQIRQGIIPSTPAPVLCVLGESGVGKTFLVEEFCKMAGLFYTTGSLAECTSSGYAGIDLTDILMGLFRNGAKRSEIEAGGIVFFDEADKRRINDRRGDFDCTGAGLQAELLRMVEGTDIQLGGRKSNDNVKGMLSTRGLCFVLAGCFDGVAHIMESKSRPKCPIGFGGHIENIGPTTDIRSALTTFFLPELCNRISTILYIKPPSLEQLIQIANAPRGVLAKQNQFLRSSLGLTLKPSEEAIKAICKYALDSKTYARGIRSLLQALQEDAIFEERKGELAIGAEEVGKVIGGLRQGGAGQE